jgi:superfamily II DNA or RNA helicase
MSGVPWRAQGRAPVGARLPWLRPPPPWSARAVIPPIATRAGVLVSVAMPAVTQSARIDGLRATAHTVDLGVLSGVARGRTSSATRKLGHAPAVVASLQGDPPLERSAALRARLLTVLQPPLELSLARSGPLEWPADLLDYQLAGIRELLERDRLLLADQMGLGKTIQAIAALRILTRRRQIASCLIIVPAAVFTYWLRQLERWAPELRTCAIRGPAEGRVGQWRMPAHVHVVGYDTLRSDAYLSSERIWDVVVVDEVQKVKNPDSDLASVVKGLSRRRAWVLTGTPLENNLEDLASVLEVVAPRLPGEPPRRLTPGVHLRNELAAIQLRRRKEEVLSQLPPKSFTEIQLEMSPQQRREYNRAENDGVVYLKGLGSSITVANILELVLRLKQLCNFEPASGASAKLDDMAVRLQAVIANGDRAIVFSQFADDQYGAAAIARRLERYRPVLYTGALTLPERDAAVQRFYEDSSRHVMVVSLRAGGQGLNLQAASYVFHFDRWWNPAVEDQATDRSHRLGQHKPVNIYAYTLEDSVEERIREILVEKRELFDRIIEGVGIGVHRFIRDDLCRIVRVAAPAAVRQNNDFFDFERAVAGRLEAAGYAIEFIASPHDGGVDLIATKFDAGGLTRSKLYVQCKLLAQPVGVEAVRELIGSLPPLAGGVTGVLAAPSGFSTHARSLARVRGIDLWGPEELRRLGASCLQR